MSSPAPATVLFDLDGTLADTAEDLGAVLNAMLTARDLPPVALPHIRPHASAGARGLIKLGFGKAAHDPDYAPLYREFLDRYSQTLCLHTCLFDGVNALLGGLEERDIGWGIVTNKAQRFALPVIEHLGLRKRSGCIVCGDSARRPKPHAHPLRLAAQLMAIEVTQAWYIGDDLRDIHAGQRAGMATAAAAWGYLGVETPVADWGADLILDHTLDLLQHIDRKK